MSSRIVQCLVVSAFALAIVTPTANAALTVRVVNTDGTGVSSRSGPQDGARNGWGAPEGATAVTVCQTWGDPVGPRANRLWWLVNFGGRQFYINDRYLSTPTVANVPIASEPWCGASSPAPVAPATPASGDAMTAAATAARARVGQVWATGGDRAVLRQFGSEWAPRNDGPPGEWSGDCYRFAALAWALQGVRTVRAPTAKAAADQYQRAGRLRGGVPPAGALVFYAWGRYGHVGVSLGGGQVVSTRGVDYQRLAVRQHGLYLGLPYRGWVDPR